MKVSIITATYNSEKNITTCLESVASQDYGNIEHIIIDGASKDNTLNIVKQFPHVHLVISEPDKGIYDALNKGLALASGEIVGFLNSDDFFAETTTVRTIVETFEKDKVDSVFGDIVFVRPDNLDRTIRYYSSKKFKPSKFAYGYMPAHPTFYTYKKFYDQFGGFKINYKISADYELLIRFLKVNAISFKYIEKIFVVMRTGGASNKNFLSRITLNREIVRACRDNGIKTNLFKVSLKFFNKALEFLVVKKS
ncbi:MAG: glycosyltransferase family 2 protein [Bacteroidota bacterium]